MAVRTVIEIGHKVLKLKNKTISDFKSPKLKKLIQDLKDTMKQVDLIGIAAPQIGENYQVFLTHPRKTKARRLGRSDRLRIFINPRVIYQSLETSTIYEGCGCLPKQSIFGPVERAKEIEIEAYDEKGKLFRLRSDGILARVILHEYDHLQGIEFVEKISDYRKLISWSLYSTTIRNSRKQQDASKISKIEFKKL